MLGETLEVGILYAVTNSNANDALWRSNPNKALI